MRAARAFHNATALLVDAHGLAIAELEGEITGLKQVNQALVAQNATLLAERQKLQQELAALKASPPTASPPASPGEAPGGGT